MGQNPQVVAREPKMDVNGTNHPSVTQKYIIPIEMYIYIYIYTYMCRTLMAPGHPAKQHTPRRGRLVTILPQVPSAHHTVIGDQKLGFRNLRHARSPGALV